MFNKFKTTARVDRLTKLREIVEEINSEVPSKQGENLLSLLNTLLGAKNQETNTEVKKEVEKENTDSSKGIEINLEDKERAMFLSFLTALADKGSSVNGNELIQNAEWFSLGFASSLILNDRENGLKRAFEEQERFQELLIKEVLERK